MSGVLAVLITILTMWASSPLDAYDWKEKVTERKICSLFNGNSTHGSFFLGIGGVSSSREYYYYLSERKGFRRYSVKDNFANDVFIREDSTEAPKLLITEYYEDSYWYEPHGEPNTDYVFVVPPGTIYEGFEAK